MKKLCRFLIITILITGLFMPSMAKGKKPVNTEPDYAKLISSMKWRNIGPAVMGGRTVDFAVVESNPSIIYAAVGPSGLWKTVNGGITWQPVFDKEGTISIGAVAVSQSNPDIVWVGTGESTCRNSVSIGDGVYKSEDGGKTWKHMGLKDTQHISRIVIDPKNPNVVYVAAMGHLWGKNKERGVYKTTDGGKTWKKILYIADDVGIADLVMDPSNNLILYAAAYQHGRKPYYFYSGGPLSGIYKTTNGGATWKKLTKGLPKGDTGRIGLAVSRSNPNVVYAIIENKKGGIFRSEDKGETWHVMGNVKVLNQVNSRPFYFSQIRVDPTNDLVLYSASFNLFVSRDGGKSFKVISRGIHPDHHALWIDPNNPLHLIDGNDGGIDISWDGGKTWYDVKNIPAAEVYHVGFDMKKPYNVFCGLQDNGSWMGPSNSKEWQGIKNNHWKPIGGGDGFFALSPANNPDIIYTESQTGEIIRVEVKRAVSQAVRPEAPLNKEPYRFNWNTPIAISPHDPNVIYLGGNYLFRSSDGGRSWEIISPDLTTNDPKKIIDSGGPITPDNTGAEVHCTIYAIAESYLEPGVIWVGTDDGNLQLTKDNGKTWTNVVKNIKGLPPNSWVSSIEPSHFDKGTVYVTFDRHRDDDFAPYVYVTHDYGKTWKSLRNNLPSFGYTHVIKEDPFNKNILYLGTEFGIFISFNRGKKWLKFNNNLPTVAVRDIAIHPRERDLIIGTHGRGVWILDDIRPIEELSKAVATDAYLFPIRDAEIFYPRVSGEYYGRAEFAAENPPFGAIINFYVKKKPEKAVLNIYDGEGKKIRTIKLKKVKEGLNRTVWDLRYSSAIETLPEEIKEMLREFGMRGPRGAFVLPGIYTVELKAGTTSVKQKVKVYPDPAQDYPMEERKQKIMYVNQANALLKQVFIVGALVNRVDSQLKILDKQLKHEKKLPEEIKKKLEDVKKKLQPYMKEFSMGRERLYKFTLKDLLRGGTLPMQIFSIQGSINSYPGLPTKTQIEKLKELTQEMNKKLMGIKEIIGKDIPELNQLLLKHKIPYIKVPKMGKTMETL